MPSTYTLNNGIELIATGEQSGTWGDTTNTNLSLLDTALDGQVTVTLPSAGTSGSPNTLAIADGSASDGRNRMVIFNDGGDLGATAYVQLTPNDAEKIIYIRNDLAGSRSIILFQGTYSASNDYEVPAGTTAVVYFDGAGSGAVAANVFNNAYFDSLRLGSVSVDKILDEDNMASDDASALATQQSIKAYVDSQVTAQDLDFGGDSGTGAVDLDSQTFTIAGTANEIETSASGQTLTVGLPDNVTITGDLTVDTDTLYVDSANNKVGIGTTSPAKQLHIESSTGGTLRLSSSDTSVGVGESLGQIDWYSNDASGSGSGVRAFVNVVENDGGLGRAYDMTFGTGQVATATERMRIDSSGNVGIGGTPTVLGGQNYVSVHSPGSSTNIAGYDLYVSGTREASLISYPNNSEALRIAGLTNRPVTFHANNAERMRIDSNGNVGIGTSAPVNNTNRATLGLQGAWGGQLDIMVGSTVHAQFGSDNFNTGLSARIQSQDGIVFRTNGNNERMRITSAGDVSISGDLTGLRYFDVYNTASTSTDGAVIRLITEQVGSTSTTSADIIKRKNGEFRISNFETNAAAYMAFNVGSSERMRIDSSGNVGIGITPSAWGDSSRVAFQVNSASIDSTGVSQMLLRSNNYYDGTDSIYVNTGAAAAYQQLNGVHTWFNAASGTAGNAISFSEVMRITSAGKMGIGTSSPDDTLTVGGETLAYGNALGGRTFGVRGGVLGGVGGDSVNLAYFGYESTNNNTAGLNLKAYRTSTGNDWTTTGLKFTFNVDNTDPVYNNLLCFQGGKLGIGTDSPDVSFHVSSTGTSFAGINTHIMASDETAMAAGVGGAILFEGNYTTSGDDAVFAGIKALKETSVSSQYGGHLAFYTRTHGSLPTERMRIQANGGISFNGDTAADNALDDYEEGSWTPTLPNGGTISVSRATYIKIGRLVHVQFQADITPTNNSSDFRIGGLPFITTSIASSYSVGSLGYSGGLDVSGWNQPLVQHLGGDYLYFQVSTASTATVLNSSFAGSTRNFVISANYEANS